jgi:hypothetical protein
VIEEIIFMDINKQQVMIYIMNSTDTMVGAFFYEINSVNALELMINA